MVDDSRGRPTPDEARDWLVSRSEGRGPNITITWTEREWTPQERTKLARILFGPIPEESGTKKP